MGERLTMALVVAILFITLASMAYAVGRTIVHYQCQQALKDDGSLHFCATLIS